MLAFLLVEILSLFCSYFWLISVSIRVSFYQKGCIFIDIVIVSFLYCFYVCLVSSWGAGEFVWDSKNQTWHFIKDFRKTNCNKLSLWFYFCVVWYKISSFTNQLSYLQTFFFIKWRWHVMCVLEFFLPVIFSTRYYFSIKGAKIRLRMNVLKYFITNSSKYMILFTPLKRQ